MEWILQPTFYKTLPLCIVTSRHTELLDRLLLHGVHIAQSASLTTCITISNLSTSDKDCDLPKDRSHNYSSSSSQHLAQHLHNICSIRANRMTVNCVYFQWPFNYAEQYSSNECKNTKCNTAVYLCALAIPFKKKWILVKYFLLKETKMSLNSPMFLRLLLCDGGKCGFLLSLLLLLVFNYHFGNRIEYVNIGNISMALVFIFYSHIWTNLASWCINIYDMSPERKKNAQGSANGFDESRFKRLRMTAFWINISSFGTMLTWNQH